MLDVVSADFCFDSHNEGRVAMKKALLVQGLGGLDGVDRNFDPGLVLGGVGVVGDVLAQVVASANENGVRARGHSPSGAGSSVGAGGIGAFQRLTKKSWIMAIRSA